MRDARVMLALACAALLAAGCAAKETRWNAEAAALAVYAQQIPLYPGIELDDVMGSDSYGDTPESHSEGLTFWFDFTDDKEKVVAWYDQRLPNARRIIEEDGTVTWTLVPPGGEPGEEMGVMVEDKRLRVFEHTRAGRHKAS